jgi:large subunit ribosomal protein LX
MSQFIVSGRYQSRGGWQAFEMEVEAPNESVAEEHTYANIGSQHGLRRTEIDIEGVSA